MYDDVTLKYLRIRAAGVPYFEVENNRACAGGPNATRIAYPGP